MLKQMPNEMPIPQGRDGMTIILRGFTALCFRAFILSICPDSHRLKPLEKICEN
jgi:hypothetical protein